MELINGPIKIMTSPTRIGFSYGKGWGGLVSRIIMFFTGAQASHVWMMYWDSELHRDMVLDADGKEIRCITWDRFSNMNHIVEIYIPKYPIDSGLPVAADELGDGYYFYGLFGMLVVEIGRFLKKKWNNPFQSSRHVFCSKWTMITMQAAGYVGAENFDPGNTDPWQIRNLLASDGSVRTWSTSLDKSPPISPKATT